MRYVMHFSPTQFVERPAKQFFRGGVHASHQPLVVHGIKPLAHVRGERFVRLQRASQCILADILEPMDKSVLTELQATVAAKDIEAFRAKYEQTLNTCYSCHVAAGKPFLRLQIPKQPEAQVVRFEPEP